MYSHIIITYVQNDGVKSFADKSYDKELLYGYTSIVEPPAHVFFGQRWLPSSFLFVNTHCTKNETFD